MCRLAKNTNICIYFRIRLYFIPGEVNVIIGDGVIIEEFVSITPNVTIGSGAIIRAGSVIGGSGFEFKKIDNNIIGITHLGGVIIGNGVEILCNVCVAASLFPWDDTKIGSQSKIDSLTYIAHGCKLGERNFVTGGVIFGGNAVLGDDSLIAPGVTVLNRTRIGSDTQVGIGSVVMKNVDDASFALGYPAKSAKN